MYYDRFVLMTVTGEPDRDKGAIFHLGHLFPIPGLSNIASHRAASACGVGSVGYVVPTRFHHTRYRIYIYAFLMSTEHAVGGAFIFFRWWVLTIYGNARTQPPDTVYPSPSLRVPNGYDHT